MEIYLEIGAKRVFAGAVAWPGWARSGRDEDAAVAALLASSPRYASALRGTRLGFRAPSSIGAFAIVERLPGNATTDFGSLDAELPSDAEPVDSAALRRFETVLRACWRAFDRAAVAAEGATLTTGPRGGGRNLAKIVEHVLDSDESYMRMLGRRVPSTGHERTDMVRAAVLESLQLAVHEGVPPSPRGGKRWTPRTFVRRSAWNVLDHAWELEDRTPGDG